MESSVGKMSNQKKREGHAVKLATNIMPAHGGLNSYSILRKEHPTNMRTSMSMCGAGWKPVVLAAYVA